LLASPRLDGPIQKCQEECWLGNHAIAFQATIPTSKAPERSIVEIYVAQIPREIQEDSQFGLYRLTHLEDRAYPGIGGPRHWLVGSRSGDRVWFLIRNELGRAQLAEATVPDGQVTVLTNLPDGIDGQISLDDTEEKLSWISQGIVHVLDRTTGRCQVWETGHGDYLGAAHFVDPQRLLVNRYVESPSGKYLQIAMLSGDERSPSR
jgi:hypothetical protein